MRRASLAAVVAAAAGLVAACGDDDARPPEPTQATQEGDTMSLVVTSAAFGEGETIPRQYTCDGADTVPPLDLSGVPSETAELALIMEDPDAPGGTFVHWVLWGVDGETTSMPEGGVPEGAVQGATSFGRNQYGGPCPPPGNPHRYIFTVYALSKAPDAAAGASADELRAAFEGSVLAEGSLTGMYGR